MPDLFSDEELAVRVQTGDESALATLMERYTGKLIRYGRRFISSQNNIEDTVQDVFVTVYMNINSFDASRQFSSWIYRIAHNAFVDVMRKKTKEPLYIDFDALIPHPAYIDPLVKEKEDREIAVLLEKGVESLSPAYREIIGLYYYENFNYNQISDILHIPVGTVGIRLSRAREALKKNFPLDHHE